MDAIYDLFPVVQTVLAKRRLQGRGPFPEVFLKSYILHQGCTLQHVQIVSYEFDQHVLHPGHSSHFVFLNQIEYWHEKMSIKHCKSLFKNPICVPRRCKTWFSTKIGEMPLQLSAIFLALYFSSIFFHESAFRHSEWRSSKLSSWAAWRKELHVKTYQFVYSPSLHNSQEYK